MGSSRDKAANAAEIDRLALIVAKEPGSKDFIPLAEEYGKAGMWNEAAAVLEDGLKHYPNFITAMVALGRAYDQLGQLIKATAILEEAVKLSPENLRAHRTLAKIYATQGQKDAALRSCRVILAVNPQDQEALSICAILGTPSVQTRMERSIRQPGLTIGQPIPEIDRQRQKQPSESAARDHRLENSTEEPIVSLAQKDMVVAQLKQWLSLIQSKRRDHSAPHSRTL